MKSIPAALADSIQRDRPLSTGDRVLVAVSGGPDSVALLHALAALLPPQGVVLGAAHLDHGMRPDSDLDARFVADLCRDWAIPLLLDRLPPWASPPSEDRLRQARYAFLEGSAGRWGADTVALAHQADDQAETVLMHLLRGSGLDGVVGMASSRGLFWRPLLGVPRAEILRYLHSHGIGYREDPSNRDLRYLRNRVRLELLPALETFNPRIRQNLVRFSGHVRQERDLLDRLLRPRWAERIRSLPEGLAVELAHPLEEAEGGRLARHLLYLLGLQAGGGEIGALALRLGKGAPSDLREVGALRLQRRGDSLYLRRADRPLRIRLPLPGEVELPWSGWRLGAALSPPPGRGETWITGVAGDRPLAIRFWQPGDRWELPGGGHQKLQDLFTNRKVPRSQRSLLPCVVQGERILYVAGLQGAPRPRPGEETVWIWARRQN